MFYKALNDEFVSVQKYFNLNAEILANELPGSITSSVINVSLFPVVESVRSTGDIRFSIREHYFDLMIIEDPRLINSPYITNLIMEYLGLYREPDFNQSQQEENFIIAIDRIMDAVSGNPEIYDYVLNFLVDGFQRFQMEKVLVHIAENFISGDCEAQSKKLLQKRLEGYERMAEGKKVPDIRIENQDGNMVSLYDLRYDYLLVVFWASWCPHCSVFLNQLKRWYPEKELDLQVFAVSIDSSKFDWEEKSLEENYPWINTYSDEGWEGKAARDFNVYATPTLFLLDKEFRILAKPLTFREFKKETDDIVKEERN
jgi:peroxiredoxin